jgi:hypothetical protein
MAGYFGLVGPTSTKTARDLLRAVKEGMLRIFYARKKSDGFGRV